MSEPLPNPLDFQRIVFFTGAGMSAESGVPTFRGPGGIWKTYDYHRYACQDAFQRDPAAVWEFHNYRRSIVGACAPNVGHHLIAQAQAHLPGRVTVITQNIDGLHQEAGAQDVIELHGALWRVRCDTCKTRRPSRENPLTEVRCPGCGGWWRPDITWFGDMLDGQRVQAAEAATAQADLFISIGTSGVVFPAAGLVLDAQQGGATLIEINPEPTDFSPIFHHTLRTSATEALRALLAPLHLPAA
jgi:NAD-dependent deacetylase